MGETSAIQWTDATVNFWTGCKKVSAGCKFCYMYRDKERYGQDPTNVLRTSDKTFYAALKWKESKRIFTCSWSDFFIREADAWRDDAWKVIRDTPQHQWQILTKRPERIKKCLPDDWGEGYPNVWLGVSVESDAMTNVDRIKYLLGVPAAIKFISFEPLIGFVAHHFVADVDWIIIGGESGNETGKYRYRKCELRWIEFIIQEYRNSFPNTAIFVKQLGTHLAKRLQLHDHHGGDIREFPPNLRIREFPKSEKLTTA